MKQHLLVKGFLLPTLSTLILFICFSIHLVCVSNYDQNYVCNHRLYVCIIPKNSSTCIAEKSHHCHRSKKWFTVHVISIFTKNQLHAYHHTICIQSKFRTPNYITVLLTKIRILFNLWVYSLLVSNFQKSPKFHLSKAFVKMWLQSGNNS